MRTQLAKVQPGVEPFRDFMVAIPRFQAVVDDRPNRPKPPVLPFPMPFSAPIPRLRIQRGRQRERRLPGLLPLHPRPNGHPGHQRSRSVRQILGVVVSGNHYLRRNRCVVFPAAPIILIVVPFVGVTKLNNVHTVQQVFSLTGLPLYYTRRFVEICRKRRTTARRTRTTSPKSLSTCSRSPGRWSARSSPSGRTGAAWAENGTTSIRRSGTRSAAASPARSSSTSAATSSSTRTSTATTS